MKLDLSKLQNVKHLSGGKTTAQCPACAADGGDAKKEHLVIYADGKFGCVVHPKDKDHNKAILKRAGTGDRKDGGSGCRLTVKPMRVEDSKVLMKVGRLGRVKPTPSQLSNQPSPPQEASPKSPDVAECRPACPAPVAQPVNDAGGAADLSEDITDEKVREFLDLPALAA